MEWVGGAATMTLGMARSVRMIVTTCNTMMATLQGFKQDSGSEMPPQCYLYNPKVFKQWNGLGVPPP